MLMNDVEFNELVQNCTRLLMTLQRKEQLIRKFTAEDWDNLKQFEKQLTEFMGNLGESGSAFLAEWSSSPLIIQGSDAKINTRELKRCLKLLVAFNGSREERPPV